MDDQPRSELRPPSRAPWAVLVLVLIAAAGAAVMWWRSRTAAPTAPAPTAAPAPAPSGTGPTGPTPTVEPGRVRALLESVSPNALFRRWLGEGDLVRRWVVVTDNLAEGVSPRLQLGFLAPSQPFSVLRRGSATVIAPAAYHRFDDIGDAVASVDAQALAGVYRELHPVLEVAYRALGYPDASLDAVTARALRRVEGAPVREGDVAVEGAKGIFTFADPRLEELGQVEKHLLRMGPRNTRLLQAKAREILQALRLPAEASAAPSAR